MNIHDVYRPILRHFRTKRIRRFYELLGVDSGTRILDVGGNGFFWRIAGELNLPKPREITILNIYDQNEDLPDG